MAWYDEAVFYHIYPLGLTGAPKQNTYGEPEHRLKEVFPWIRHMKEIGCNALYIGPVFESVGHGYETTDYKKLDSRLGTNEDLKDFVAECHKEGIRVILDGVFNHTGRDFFAFQDIKKNRENSRYKDWYCNVNFWGNNEYNDGFSYENWGGYNLLVKLNQHNPEVRDYICDVVRFWVSEFDIDGIRLDAADVLDFSYMQALRRVANEVKPEFWLMGEVIHGDYNRWVNEGTLHSVTNYHLHKALYSGNNDHNFFEIAHTVKRLYGMGGNKPDGLKLYNFVDNHDVERIYTKLTNKAHYTPVHILLYTLPGVPSIYYGSEFGIEGRKEKNSDDSLRPALHYEDYKDAVKNNPCTRVIAALGKIRQNTPALSYGDYQELVLTNRQYAYSRNYNGVSVVVAVNNDDNPAVLSLPAGNAAEYVGTLSGDRIPVQDGRIHVTIQANSGDIFVPAGAENGVSPVELKAEKPVETETRAEAKAEEKAETQAEAKTQDRAEYVSGGEVEVKQKPEAGDTAARKAESMPGGEVEVKQKPEAGDVAAGKAESVSGGEVEVKQKPEAGDAAAGKAESVSGGATEGKKETEIPRTEYVDVSVTEGKSYESMTVEELQEAVLSKMAKNGPINDQMLRSVRENVYHNSLVNWVKSFR